MIHGFIENFLCAVHNSVVIGVKLFDKSRIFDLIKHIFLRLFIVLIGNERPYARQISEKISQTVLIKHILASCKHRIKLAAHGRKKKSGKCIENATIKSSHRIAALNEISDIIHYRLCFYIEVTREKSADKIYSVKSR